MKAILFDVDDTLYDLSEPFCNAYTELYGQTDQSLLEEIFLTSRKYSDEVYNEALSGKITMEEMYIYRVQKAFAEFEKKITDADALEFQNVYEKYQFKISLSRTMRQLLEECRKRWILGVITNGPTNHQWDKINTLGLTQYIPKENIFVSGQLGVSKPQKEIFTYACRHIGVSTEESCFVGDTFQNDIIGAKNAGMKAVWFQRRKTEVFRNIQPDWTVHTEAELFQALMRFGEQH